MKKIAFLLLFVLSLSAQAQVVINEICPANADINYDPDFFNFSGWIELYNAGTSNVTLTGFYLSDKQGKPLKWRIPVGTVITAKGYALIWCDEMNTGRHTNFDLDSEGEDVVLSDVSGTLLDKVSFPKQFTNISYGRTPNGTGTWNFLSTPTPGGANNSVSATEQLAKPGFSVSGGRYAGTQQLVLTHSKPNVEIRFTTDGSEPTSGSEKFTGPISISQTKIIKAKAFLDGFLPGQTETHTYFINEHTFSIPVISLSTKPAYLYDNTIGIYIAGTNGIINYCSSTPLNWNQDWDRHAVFEYFDKDGNKLLNQSVDIRIGGNCSRQQAQKSFAVKARDKYGKNIINFKFFENKSNNQFGGLMLRNSGNDFNVTMFRDALMQAIPVGQMDVDYMDYQPAALYLNGEYMGIQNIREKIDADFIESNYSVDKDDLDLIETYENALEGSSTGYTDYKDALGEMDSSTPEAFAFIDQHIDVQEYINYLVAEIYYANTDWPGNNMKFWRDRSANGKFRWILWDTDFGFALYDGNAATHPTLNFATATNGPEWPNPAWSTLHIRMVLENPIFRSRFIQTMNTALNTTFHPDRVIAMINQFESRIATEMPYHKQRWGGSNWTLEVQRLRNFAVARNTFMRQHMADFFGLNETVKISAAVKAGEGKIKLNEVTFDASTENQSFFKGLPVNIKPIPAIGYAFKEWKIKKQESTEESLINTGAIWKYFDQNSRPANWETQAFNDGSWQQGPAQLGYGEEDQETTTGFGPESNNKYITTYFRNTFSVADTVGLTQLTGSILVDDGAVIYLNGTEISRINMPAVTITHTTLSTGTPAENVYVSFTIPKGVLKPGSNTLAVEVHQNTANSTDMSFDLSLSTLRLGTKVQVTSAVAIQKDTANYNLEYEAYFEPSGIVVNGLVINEISASPSELLDNAGEAEDWIEVYNAGTQAINLAGLFITDNLNGHNNYKMKAGTGNEMVLQPGAYKILWADEDKNQGADHIDFKLSADGEAVGIYQIQDESKKVLDEVVFSAQVSEGSFSRIPNATGPFRFMSSSTPGFVNEVITGIEEEISVSIFPNPVTSVLIIDSPDRLQTVQLMDCMGRSLQSFINVQHQEISMHNNPAGIYILRLKSGNRLKTLKIIKQ